MTIQKPKRRTILQVLIIIVLIVGTFVIAVNLAPAGTVLFMMTFAIVCPYLVIRLIEKNQLRSRMKRVPPYFLDEESRIPKGEVRLLLNTLPIQFKLLKSAKEPTEVVYPMIVQRDRQLGASFSDFVLKHPNIEINDPMKAAYGWKFYVDEYKGFRRRTLDANMTLRENLVTEHTIIIAERVTELADVRNHQHHSNRMERRLP